MTFGEQLQQLSRSGNLIAAKALLEAFPDELLTAQQDPGSDAARLVLDHASYLRGWTTLQLRLRHIVGSGPAPLTRPTGDLLLISHPHSAALRRWVGTTARITETVINRYRTELDGTADPLADLADNLALPLDRYVDQAIETITAQAIVLGAPLLVVDGSPWLAVAVSAAAHRLGLPFWWDLRRDDAALTQIVEGRPYSAAVPGPSTESAFRAAASADRLIVNDEQVGTLRAIPELRERLLAIGSGPHGTTPTARSEWAAWRMVQQDLLPSAARKHYVGLLGAAATVPRVPRLALVGDFDGFPHDHVVLAPDEIRPEEVDGLVIDARTPQAWAAARDRAIQARTFHLPIVAIGLPAPAERPFADMVATIGPVPREARTSGHQPQWGFVAVSDNPTGYRTALRAAGLQIGAPAFAAFPAEPRHLAARERPQLQVFVRDDGGKDALEETLGDIARQSLHRSLFTCTTLGQEQPMPAQKDANVVVGAGDRFPADFLLQRWLNGQVAVV